MKKLLMLLGLMVGFVAISNAQTTAPKTSAKETAKPAKVVKMHQEKATTQSASTAAKTKTVAKKATDKTEAASTAHPAKADGTPDMRYKANKTTKAAPGPKKADGTPDMRYKANKAKVKG